MIDKLFGFLILLIYKMKYGKSVCFEGIPSIVRRQQIFVKAGRVDIGKNFILKQGVYIAAVNNGKVLIGNNVSFNRNVILVSHDTISIGDHVAVGPNTVFYDHDHNFDETGIISGYKTGPIVIGSHVWIGAGVTILRDTIIGEGSVIGAGCIVQGVIPPHSLVTSNRELNILHLKGIK